MKKYFITVSILLFLVFPSLANEKGKQISILIIDADTYFFNKAINEMQIPDDIKINLFTYHDIVKGKSAKEFIDKS